jgi:hypothetical protein
MSQPLEYSRSDELRPLYSTLLLASKKFRLKSKLMTQDAFTTFAIKMNPSLKEKEIKQYFDSKKEFGDSREVCSLQDYLSLIIMMSHEDYIFSSRNALIRWESYFPFRLLEQTKFLSLFREKVHKKNANTLRDFVVESLFELDTSNSFDVQSQAVWAFRRVENKQWVHSFLEIGLQELSNEQNEQLRNVLNSIVKSDSEINFHLNSKEQKLKISLGENELIDRSYLLKMGLVDRFNVDFEIEARLTTNKHLHDLLSGQALLDSDLEFSVDIFGSDLPLEMAHVATSYVDSLLKGFYQNDVKLNLMSMLSEIKRIELNSRAKRQFLNKFLMNEKTGISLPVHLFWSKIVNYFGKSKLNLIYQLLSILKQMNVLDGSVSLQANMLDVHFELRLQEPGHANSILNILCRDFSLSNLIRNIKVEKVQPKNVLQNILGESWTDVDVNNFGSIQFGNHIFI